MENKLIEIFIGSDIEVEFISSILTENNIGYIIDNALSQSLLAGWVNGSSYNSSIIRIDVKDFDLAKRLIDEYLKNNHEQGIS